MRNGECGIVSADRAGRVLLSAFNIPHSAFIRIGNFLVLGIVALSGSACRRAEPPDAPREAGTQEETPWFEEVAADVKVDFKHVPYVVQRFYFPEIVPGGVGLFDYDADGYLDIYFVQGGEIEPSAAITHVNKLYRNRGDGTFEDVTASAGVGDTGYGMGCACADYDNDGDVDLYVTNLGPNVLYRNNADGTFTDVTTLAGVGDSSWGTSCAFVDIDADGDLDIFVANYVTWSANRELICRSSGDKRDYCKPTNYKAPAPDTLYRNNGDGSFTDVSKPAGLGKVFGNGLGVTSGDFDGDGHTDIYVTNDLMPNQLWVNNGQGRFTDRALLLGCALSGSGAAEAGMGVMAIDFENDGDLDLFMSHFRNESNTFYVNDGDLFDDVTARVGLAAPSLPFTGFGLGFADFDHDGVLDLFVANGRVDRQDRALDPHKPYAEPNLLFKGGTEGRFTEEMPRGGTARLLNESSRGAAFGDLDNDGDIDIVVVNLGGPAHILRNIVGSRGEWVMFRVVNRRGSDAIGARVRIDAGGNTQWRSVQPAYSYCASNDPRVHFGLGRSRTIDQAIVRWPGGRQESFGPFTAGQVYELREGTRRGMSNVE